MKLRLLGLLLILGSQAAHAGSLPSIVQDSKTPTLRTANIRFDSSTRELVGIVYLNHGAQAPRLPHVHVYAFNKNGTVIFSGCAELSGNSLQPHTRPNPNPSERFSIQLPADYRNFAQVKVVTDSEDRCVEHG